MTIKDNIINLKQALPPGCQLVAVSKFQSPEKISEAYNAGQRLFGENKVQELLQKYEVSPKDIQWHMIGHLQTNKVKQIVPFVSLIQSVDSERLLAEIDKQASKYQRRVACLLQVHIAKEETKFGFSEEEVKRLVEKAEAFSHIQIVGLMGMASFTNDSGIVHSEFTALKSLFDMLSNQKLPGGAMMKELSMGMSQDYLIAIEHGSTMVRIGTAIFGERTVTPG